MNHYDLLDRPLMSKPEAPARAKSDTVARILDGALVALARRGVHELSMTDVGHVAGISRGTLYRYFSSKEELLDAIGGHVQRSMIDTLVRAVDETPALDRRVDVVVETVVNAGKTHPETYQVIALEPSFGFPFVRTVFPEFFAVAEKLLAPALEKTRAVTSGALTVSDLAELIMRVCGTTFFLPTPDIGDVPRAIAGLTCLHDEG